MDRSAGIIVIRYFNDEPRVLCLKVYSSYDLPKGHLEEDESTLEAALRETSEEAGITDIDFRWGRDAVQVTNTGRRKKQVTMFIAVTTQDAHLRQNPETGKYEHHGIKWMSFDEAEAGVHPYLRPAVSWARKKMEANPED